MLRPQPLSTYARQHLLLKAAFAAKYPHAWLVWRATETQGQSSGASETWVPGKSPPIAVGDPLCFELAGSERVRIGSGDGNEVKVDAVGVAPEHCVLTHEAGSWVVSSGESVPSVDVSGNPVAGGIAVPLSSADEITLGAARICFLTAEAFVARVAEESAKL